ncbi:MAG: holo-ACP synthase [Clostridia bacterium]|nr:holo-ACP synthase [Clostridia bacterium]
MILGVGLDLADIERIEKAIRKPHFLERIYSEEERLQIEKKGAQTAAGYWAAKEAVAKALGTGFRGFNMWDISIQNDELGKPEAILKNGALTRLNELGGGKIIISITHSQGFAAAVAILSTD